MCFYLMEICQYLLQYTRLEVHCIQNEVSDNWAYGLYYAQLSDTWAEALLLGCDMVHVQTWLMPAPKHLFLTNVFDSVLVYGCRRI